MNGFLRVFIIASIGVLGVFLYGSYRCNHPEYKDILEKKLGIGELDCWSLVHFTLFTIIGYVTKPYSQMIFALGLGVVWELFEHYYGTERPGWLGGYGDCKNLASDKEDDGNWWYGKWTDIVMNLLGLLFGVGLRKVLFKSN